MSDSTATAAAVERDPAAFPTLDEGQLRKVAECTVATLRTHRAGDVLYDAGERNRRFYVIRAGEIEILDPATDPPKRVTVHGPGNFTGDVSHLTGGPTVVRAVARTDCETYELSSEQLRQLINRCPEVGDIFLNAFIVRRHLMLESGRFTGLRVIGSRYSKDTFRIREFLTRNRIPFTWTDLEADATTDRLIKGLDLKPGETPIVAWGKVLLKNPSDAELARTIGIKQPLEQKIYDLAIVGAGPAGLAASVYAASEGLNTILLELSAPGGQAAFSPRIENYLGFPAGISGADLADRAVLQATKFGAILSVSTPARELAITGVGVVLKVEGGETIEARCLLIATGAEYRRLGAENCERYEGTGVYYAATRAEAEMCFGQEAVVVGGGNSAGQGATYLAAHARRVYLIVRGDDLGKNMSSYLVHRIRETPNIEVLLDSEVRRMSGDDRLQEIEVVNTKTGETRTIRTPVLISFIGAVPRTQWLPAAIERDPNQFVCTGPGIGQSARWKANRAPYLLETSEPGVFAAGDVRSGSVKRVASAAGEGAMAIQFVHAYLRDATPA